MRCLVDLVVGAAVIAALCLPAAGQTPVPAPGAPIPEPGSGAGEVGRGTKAAAAPNAAEADSSERGTLDAPFWVMMRSLVVPGWGQAKNGKWLKALLVAGLEAAFVERLVFENRMVHYNRDRILSEPELADVWRIREKHHQSHRRDFIWWTSLYVLLAMGDAYVDAHLRDFDVGLQAEPEPADGADPKAGAGLSLRLSVNLWPNE